MRDGTEGERLVAEVVAEFMRYTGNPPPGFALLWHGLDRLAKWFDSKPADMIAEELGHKPEPGKAVDEQHYMDAIGAACWRRTGELRWAQRVLRTNWHYDLPHPYTTQKLTEPKLQERWVREKGESRWIVAEDWRDVPVVSE